MVCRIYSGQFLFKPFKNEMPYDMWCLLEKLFIVGVSRQIVLPDLAWWWKKMFKTRVSQNI
jgi:hypothetical protein